MISRPVGAKYRRKSSGYHKAYEIWPLSAYRKNYEAILPVEPGMNYPEINDGWLPHAIDVDRYTPSWSPPANKMVVSAYTANIDSKLVHKYLEPALSRIKKDGANIELVLSGAENHVEHQVFLQRLRQSTVYYGQITPLGVYGRSEVEAMAMGVPVIAGIKDFAVKRALPIKGYGEPCLKAYDVAGLAGLLGKIADKKIDLEDVSKKGREYAVRVHSYKSVAAQITAIINDIAGKRV
jgi:hypothetical protein